MYNKETWKMIPDRHMNPHEFYKWVQAQTRKHNVKTKLTKGGISYYDYDGKRVFVCGTFTPPEDDESGQIITAYGDGEIEWLHTMAHEYVHFLQWVSWEEELWDSILYLDEDDEMYIEFECTTDYHALLILEYAGLLHKNMVSNHNAAVDMMTNDYGETVMPSNFNAEERWWLKNANV